MTRLYDFRCPCCGIGTCLALDIEAVANWRNGALVQNVFPELSATDRETIISGLCADCQSEIFGEEEEEDDYEDYDLEMGFNPYSGSYDWDC